MLNPLFSGEKEVELEDFFQNLPASRLLPQGLREEYPN
jgi:hypothetical protein